MADDAEAIHAAELKKKRQFRKYAYRGVDLEDLLDKSSEEVFPSPGKANGLAHTTRPRSCQTSFPTRTQAPGSDFDGQATQSKDRSTTQ